MQLEDASTSSTHELLPVRMPMKACGMTSMTHAIHLCAHCPYMKACGMTCTGSGHAGISMHLWHDGLCFTSEGS